ncbi:hypothetical protein ACHAWC_008815 [Mediolabrus comicus]
MKKNVKISKAVAAVLLLLAVAASCSLFFRRNIYFYQTEAHRNLQEVTQPQYERAETLRRLEETEDIWLSRWKNQEMYADLKEKYKFRQANFNFEEQQSNGVEKLTVCGRETKTGTANDLALLQHFKKGNECPGSTSKNLLLLQGDLAHGRTGNNLIEFLHALQLSHDMDYQIAVTPNSWVYEVLLKMWFNSSTDEDWEQKFMEEFCIKIYRPERDSLVGWNLVPHDVNSKNSVLISKYMFNYMSELPLEQYIAFQSQFIQKLYRNYNTAPDDMCSGINAIFGQEEGRRDVIYTAIHNRHLEGAPGIRLMQRMRRGSGCHPTAALEMRPEYIKAILRPLGMLQYPIVLITDGEDPTVEQRLKDDPEIGPMLRLVPADNSWIGGDITLATMSNVFIGNPASSFSGFIAKARIAFGFGHNHLFRTTTYTTDGGEEDWVTTCGDTCVYDKAVMGNMS